METGSHWQQADDDEVDDDWACIDTSTAAAADDDDHRVVSRTKAGTRKRLYEHGEGELDREMDKMYKRDYWEDPAYAPLLELSGLLLARADAVLCFSERTLRATDAMLAQRWQEWDRRSSRANDEPEPARAAAAGEGRSLFCF